MSPSSESVSNIQGSDATPQIEYSEGTVSVRDLTPTPFRGPLGRRFRDCSAHGNKCQPTIGTHHGWLGKLTRHKTLEKGLKRATAGDPIRLPVPVT